MTQPRWILIILIFCNGIVYSQEKLAQTGFQFLSVGQDARASAMGEAFTTVQGSPNTVFYNPAGIAGIDARFALSANTFNWIADINYSSLSLVYKPWEGTHGAFAFSFQIVDYGELQGTVVWENSQGYLETEVFEPAALAIGAAYARNLTEKFVVGLQVRYVSQTLGKSAIPGEGTKKNIADVLSFDMGTVYDTGFKTLKFGMSVRNFSEEIKFEEEGFQLPLTFKIGISAEPLKALDMFDENHQVLVVVDAVHPRSYPEYLNLGAEYTVMQMFSIRSGYISNHDENGFTAGFGLRQYGFNLDYAYTPFGVFDNVHRFSLGFMY